MPSVKAAKNSGGLVESCASGTGPTRKCEIVIGRCRHGGQLRGDTSYNEGGRTHNGRRKKQHNVMQEEEKKLAGSIFKCMDLVWIYACLPYRAVNQDGYSLECSHHQDMSKLHHHQFPANLNSAVPVIVSRFLCLSRQPHMRISHQSSLHVCVLLSFGFLTHHHHMPHQQVSILLVHFPLKKCSC